MTTSRKGSPTVADLAAQLRDLQESFERMERRLDQARSGEARDHIAGRVEAARRTVAALAAELADLAPDAFHEHNLNMTKVQKQRRADRVSEAKAFKSGRPIAIAIARSQWRNITRYARERARCSQPALSRYISGDLECPPEVADRVREDLGLDDTAWPRPPRR